MKRIKKRKEQTDLRVEYAAYLLTICDIIWFYLSKNINIVNINIILILDRNLPRKKKSDETRPGACVGDKNPRAKIRRSAILKADRDVKSHRRRKI